MFEILVILLVLLLSFVIRIPFVLSDSSDEWMTWWIIRQQQGRKLHYDVYDSLIDGYMALPKLQYFLVSCFPEKYWGIIGNGLNVLYDLISILLVYSVSSIIFSAWQISPKNFIISPAAWVALLYSTTPILLPITARLSGIKARTLGGLLSLLYFLTFGAAYIFGETYGYLGTIVSGILIILSSAFTLQNIAFISLCLTILYLDWVPFAIFLITVLAGIAIPGIGVRKILIYKFNHYKWYVSNYAGTTAEGRNNLRDIVLLPRYFFTEPAKFLEQVMSKNTFVISLYSVPVLFILIYLCIDRATFSILISNDVTKYAATLIAGSVIVFILTSTKPFLFLGQAERYFEYSAAFLSFVLVCCLANTGASPCIPLLLFLFHLCVILITFCYCMIDKFIKAIQGPLASTNVKELIQYINSIPGPVRILTIPAKFSYVLSYHFNNPRIQFYHMFVTQDNNQGFDYMNEDLMEYNWARIDLLHFKRKYDVNTVVVYKAALQSVQKSGLIYKFAQKNCMFENEEYAVYRL